jgi:putative membrane protein
MSTPDDVCAERRTAMMYYGHGLGMGWSMIVLAVVVPALIIAAVLFLVQFRHPTDNPGAPAPDPIPDAERTLSDRFARGEIATEEYEERLRTLRAARR